MTKQMAQISDVAEVNPRLPAELSEQKEREVDFVPMAQLSEKGYVETNGSRLLGEVLKGYTYFANGDVIVAKITPCMENGKAAFVNNLPHGVAFGSTEFHVLRPGPEVDGRYLFYMVWNPVFRHNAEGNMTGSAGQKRVPVKFFDRFPIPLPPLPEQKRIADILDKADAIRRKRQEAAADVSALRRSVFLDLFGNPASNERGWQEIDFADVLSGGMRNGISPSRSGKEQGKVLVLSAITGNIFDCAAVKESTFAAPFNEEQLVTEGEFLICRGNGNIRMVGAGRFPTRSLSDTVFPDTMIAARIDTGSLAPEYLEELWSTRHVRRQIESGARTTNGTHKVNQGVLSAIRIPLPPLKEQQRFAEAARTIRQLHHRLKSPLTDNLFNSLVQRAFRGDL